MKTLVASMVCACCLLVAGDGIAARAKPGRGPRHVGKTHRAHAQRTPRKAPSNTALAEHADELVLSPKLLRQLQLQLIAAGYLRGTVDERLTPRTRRALAEFQRDYHRAGTGALDRETADALLGRECVAAFLLAKQ
jgi:peptidoglycan hydrolase-like protein with peptidoglycan-binding domain